MITFPPRSATTDKPRGRRLVCAGALALLAGCQVPAPEPCKVALATDLPLTLRRGHILTPALLNGLPTIMVLDTGAQRTTLTTAATHRLDIATARAAGIATGIGGSRAMYVLQAKSFQIGRLTGKHLRLAVTDMRLALGPTEADGLLGADFLAAYDLDLDLAARQARLYRAVQGCATPATLLDGNLFVAPLLGNSNEFDARPMVTVRISGKTLTALIDTGADHTVIFRDAAGRLGLRLQDLTADPQLHEAGIGPRTRNAVRHIMSPITVGEITVSNLPVAILDQPALGSTDMLLGLDFLARVHVWLSFSSRTLVMQYPPAPSQPIAE